MSTQIAVRPPDGVRGAGNVPAVDGVFPGMSTLDRRLTRTVTACALGIATALSATACASTTATGAGGPGTATAPPSVGDRSAPVPATRLFAARADVVASAVRAAGLVTTPTPGSVPPHLPPADRPLAGAEAVSTGPDGTLVATIGRGACDTVLGELVEYDDLVVVGATVTTRPGPCTAQLVLGPVTLTLTRPLGGRVVFSVGDGAVLPRRAG